MPAQGSMSAHHTHCLQIVHIGLASLPPWVHNNAIQLRLQSRQLMLFVAPALCLPDRIRRICAQLPDPALERVVSHMYLTTTSTGMADDRPWEHEYCYDEFYKAPTEEERAKLQVHC